MSGTVTVDGSGNEPTLPAPQHAPPLEPGAKVGRYVILEQLGAGGMGIVYAARDPELRRDVAVKVLHPGWLGMPDARARFVREAQTMAQLSHPNLMPIWDVGTIGEQLFLAMPKLDGTLRQWLESPRGWREALAMVLACARGLAAAHAKGIVHRDFKPENVLLGDDGAPRVADFGIARSVAETSDPAGTPRYMAPEQRSGDAVDARADQYSFSVVAREAVSAPPRWLGKILARGLADDPAARWPSLDAMIDAVERQERRRRRRLAIGGGIVVLGIAAAGVAMMMRGDSGHAVAADVDGVRLSYDRADNGERIGTITGDGTTLAFSSGKTVWLEDRASGARTDLQVPGDITIDQLSAPLHAGPIAIAAHERDGTHGEWIVAPGAAPVRVRAGGDDLMMAIRPDGGAVAIGLIGRIDVVDARGAPLQTLTLAYQDPYVMAWDPAGARFAVVHDTDKTTQVDVLGLDGTKTTILDKDLGGAALGVSWVSADRLAVAMTTPQMAGSARTFVQEVDLDGHDALVTSRDGEMFAYVVSTSAGLFVESMPLAAEIMTAPLDGLHDDADLRMLPTGSRRDVRVAGWLDDGSLLFATYRGDTLGVGRQAPGGAFQLVEDSPGEDMPAGFVGGDVIALRKDSGRCEVTRGDRVLAEIACSDLPTLTCADGHAPCLVARGMPPGRRYAWLDLDSGAIGAPVYVDPTPPTARAAIAALSPDGGSLAIAHFAPTVDVIDLKTGTRRTLTPGDDLRIQCLGWMPDGSGLLATDAQEAQISLGRLSLDGVFTRMVSSPVRWYCDPRVTRDGKTLAVIANDLTASYWLFEGYRGG